jgi:hypothetical protein
MKNIAIKITRPLKTGIKIFINYSRLIIFISFSIMIGIITVKVGEYSRLEPTSDQVISAKTSKNTKIDQESLLKLKELEDNNVSIEALFNNGRTNPFEN